MQRILDKNNTILGRKQNREDREAQEDRDEGAMERIIKFSGVTDETVGREQILEKVAEVDFTCFERGKTEGFLLVKKGQVAKDLVGKMEQNPGMNSLHFYFLLVNKDPRTARPTGTNRCEILKMLLALIRS